MSKKSLSTWQPWLPDEITLWPGLNPVINSQHVVSEAPLTDQSEKDVLAHINQLDDLKAQAKEIGYQEGYAAGQQAGLTDGQQQGYQAGYQQGLAEGHQAGTDNAKNEMAAITQQWQALLSEFRHSLEGLDSFIASRLMQIALQAARQVLGQPAVCDGSALLNQISHFLQQDPLLTGRPQLQVNPNDMALVESQLGDSLTANGWRLIAVPELHLYGCKISAENSELDASLETRWLELCQLIMPEKCP
ncbi:flagellar assembly protein FliH [Arsenophonus nasoniae]|uniref:Flagellar assembly protein FliH n=1 Tax=Arsenophonus nasoniae TaxID=638 RepID=A0AA95GDG8_9GAMM|nr:flagellar assembly protein FliH [Arsenophonus nasoniae]WGL96232.1 flagellar assembly protein FliH [Arsenophonus nasoniae]